MILDLHNHSIKSDDARARVDNYCRWIRSRELRLDGFVLTEHRQFDAESDYRPLEDAFGLRITDDICRFDIVVDHRGNLARRRIAATGQIL